MFEAGPFAVISFFFISGFVMASLYQKYFVTMGEAFAYYRARAIRILPQYFFFAAITLLLLIFFGAPKGADFVSGRFDAYAAFANITIIPLDFYVFDHAIAHMMLVPQAFTLGLEIIFYLLVPLFVMSRALRLAAFVISAAVYVAAFFGFLDPDIYGYRLLPGTLVFFLMGMYLADKGDANRKPAMAIGYAMFVILLAILTVRGPGFAAYNYTTISVLIGAVTGFPIVVYLSQKPMNKADTMLGSASYGMFLCHILIIWWLRHAGVLQGHNITEILLFRVVALTLSLAGGFLGYYLVERPFVALRHRARAKARQEVTQTISAP
jgi:peptidoglycan/LPS O-acetylase OafA/YrhL